MPDVIRVGGVVRRVHSRDVGQGYPNVNTDEYIRSKLQNRMYKNWKSLSQYSHQQDSSLLPKNSIPIGRTLSKRTAQIQKPTQDVNNYHQKTTTNFLTPGPRSYEGVYKEPQYINNPNTKHDRNPYVNNKSNSHSYTALGLGNNANNNQDGYSSSSSQIGGIHKNKTKEKKTKPQHLVLRPNTGTNLLGTTWGTTNRACMTYKRNNIPGPGAYDIKDEAYMGYVNGTIDMRVGQSREIQNTKAAKHGIKWRIERIKEAHSANSKLPLEVRRTRIIDGKKNMDNYIGRIKSIDAVLQDMKQIESEKVCNPETRIGRARCIQLDRSRPQSYPMSSKCDRWFDPVFHTSTPLTTPGVNSYALDPEEATFGAKNLKKLSPWSEEIRPTDPKASNRKMLATVKLDKYGMPYYSDYIEPAPCDYGPPNFVPPNIWKPSSLIDTENPIDKSLF